MAIDVNTLVGGRETNTGDSLKVSSDIQEKIRQQFDTAPYPHVPLKTPPTTDADFLFIHNLVTPYYLRYQRVVSSEGMTILDAGCGSGYKALILASANPGATIVGVDLSAESVEVAKQRLHYHGFTSSKFYQITLEMLPSLGMEFDYINCDEVLTILPDLTAGLQALKAVLKPQGIIRGNLHSARQRKHYFAAQKLFSLMNLMDGNPEELEMTIARETMAALRDDVQLKQTTWNVERAQTTQFMLMNYLYQGDKGFTIPDLFAALRASDLELVSMVNWRRWELLELFSDPNDLPAFWAMSLPNLSAEEQLTLFELFQPVNRLLDFWCGHPIPDTAPLPVMSWSPADWQGAVVHLHPQIRTDQVRTELQTCITKRTSFCLSNYLAHPVMKDVSLESSMAALLLPLWEGAQPIASLVAHWQRIKPVDPVTLEPIDPDVAFAQVTQFLARLETTLYVLIEGRS